MIAFDFSNKTALITGSDRGIGKSIAEEFAKYGIRAVLTSRTPAIIQSCKELKKQTGADLYAVQADLTKADERKMLVEESYRLLGHLDILVNNAGIQIRHRPENFPIEDFEKVININLTAVFDLCRLAGYRMLQQGSGCIINIASMLSFFGGTTVPAYAASKGGVAQLTKALSNDWAKQGVRVNAVAPGYIITEMNRALMEDPVRYSEIVSRIPVGRFGQPQDIAGTVLFLSSDAASYISGAVIPVDGGYLGR